MSRLLRVLLPLLAVPALALSAVTVLGSPASAHEEREASFPSGTGSARSSSATTTPAPGSSAGPTAPARVARMPAGTDEAGQPGRCSTTAGSAPSSRRSTASTQRGHLGLRAARRLPRAQVGHRAPQRLLLPPRHRVRRTRCSRRPTSAASPSPGERPEADGQEAAAEEESDPIALSYADQRRCPGNLNLISVFGDRTPRDDSIACNSRFCGLQIVGTGARKGDVLIDNDFQKLNAIRADRAGGIVIRNLTAQQAEFNAIYVLETDGFLLDRVVDPRQRRVRHPRVRQRPRRHPAHEQLLQRRLGHLSRLGLRPQRGQRELRAEPLRDRDPPQPQPPQHAGLLRARPATRSTPTTTASTATPPASRPTRCSPATPGCPRTTPGGAATRSTATTPTTTRSTSTPGSAPSRCGSGATSRAPSAR